MHSIFLYQDAESTAQVIYEYYAMKEKYDEDLLPLIYAANGDAHGEYTHEELSASQTWEALSSLIDIQTLDFVKSLVTKHYAYA